LTNRPPTIPTLVPYTTLFRSMKANLPKAEPEMLARWEAMDIYLRLRAASQNRPLWILHDGPPYANGHIHMGTALNKILKDVIVKDRKSTRLNSSHQIISYAVF